MSDRFICTICGKEHAGLPNDWGCTLPDVVWAIPEPERSAQAKFTADLCQFGERYFIRCVLKVPFSDTQGYFGWGVWAEVEGPIFERYVKLYDQDGSAEPPHEGTLANAIPAYKDTLGTRVQIRFGSQTQRPTIDLLPTDRFDLAVEQHNGIDSARHHEILNQLSSRR